jgi:hypothetical protein
LLPSSGLVRCQTSLKASGAAFVFFTDQAGKAHAGQRTVGFGADIEQFGIELHDVRFLRELVALLELHLDFGGHFGAAELADVLHVAAIVGGLQADEVELGLAQEAVDIESRRGCSPRMPWRLP